MPPETTHLPIAIIGAGPIGLAAAVHLSRHGLQPLILEAGPGPGSSVESWGHVRVFSPWREMVDGASRKLLEDHGWTMPDEEHLPTGNELVEEFLQPLAAVPSLRPHIRYGHTVRSVTRKDFDKMRSGGRGAAPFELICETEDGAFSRVLARAVIDASGTVLVPNALGSGTVPAPGEEEARDRIHYGIPDVSGAQRSRYARRHSLVVGAGHSAFNALLDLALLMTEEPGTRVTWAVRAGKPRELFGGEGEDPLAARAGLGSRLRQLVEIGMFEVVTGFQTREVQQTPAGLVLKNGRRSIGPIDEVVATTGYRPDLEMLRELRLDLDPVLESPRLLAPLIDPEVHSCSTVPVHGAEHLEHPEQDFFIVGMKSYGRAPNFLLRTGYEQVRSVAAALAGAQLGTGRSEVPHAVACSPATTSVGCCSAPGAAPATTTTRAGVGCECG